MGLTVFGVRHGEVHNPEGVIYSGLPGYHLSEQGRRQAQAVGEALRSLRVVALYASPLDRGIETATLIAEAIGVDVVPDVRLHEWRYWQQWAGMTWEDLRTKGREAWEAYQGDPGSVTTGESLAELAYRMESWLSDVRKAHEDGVVVGVTHLEPLRAVLLRMLNRPARDLFDLQIGLGQGVRLVPDPDPTPLGLDALRSIT